jgi:hypothetical protein
MELRKAPLRVYRGYCTHNRLNNFDHNFVTMLTFIRKTLVAMRQNEVKKNFSVQQKNCGLRTGLFIIIALLSQAAGRSGRARTKEFRKAKPNVKVVALIARPSS